jgi:hypothetical protein
MHARKFCLALFEETVAVAGEVLHTHFSCFVFFLLLLIEILIVEFSPLLCFWLAEEIKRASFALI